MTRSMRVLPVMRALLGAVGLAVFLGAGAPLWAQAQKPHPSETPVRKPVHDVERKPGEGYHTYHARLQRTRETRDWQDRSGTHHFESIDDFVAKTSGPGGSPTGMSWLQQKRLADVYISTGTGLVGGKITVRMTRLDDGGEAVTKFGVFAPDTPAAEAYASIFGADASDAVRAQLGTEFQSLSVVLDDSAFFLRTTGNTGSPTRRVKPVLALPSSHKGRIHIRNSGVDPYGAGGAVRALPIAVNRVETLIARIGEPAVFATPPPGSAIRRLDALARIPFKASALSVVLLEGNTDARRALEVGRRSGALSIAADLGGEIFGDASLKARLESEFQLRAKSGKVMAIVGHHENGTDKLFVRLGATNLASITRQEILRMSETYDIEVLLLGCRTASAEGNSHPLGSLLKDVNSEAVITALAKSAQTSSNWREFLSNLSSEETPLVFGSRVGREPSGSQGRADLHNGRLPDGRSYVMAVIYYRIRCAVVGDC